jgi:hypothetical protein
MQDQDRKALGRAEGPSPRQERDRAPGLQQPVACAVPARARSASSSDVNVPVFLDKDQLPARCGLKTFGDPGLIQVNAMQPGLPRRLLPAFKGDHSAEAG